MEDRHVEFQQYFWMFAGEIQRKKHNKENPHRTESFTAV